MGERQRRRLQRDALSMKQLTTAALEGRLVTFIFSSGRDLRGYICGVDDFHWMVSDQEGETHLVHKTAPETVTVSRLSTLGDEPQTDRITAIVEPFRQWVLRERSQSRQTHGSTSAARKHQGDDRQCATSSPTSTVSGASTA